MKHATLLALIATLVTTSVRAQWAQCANQAPGVTTCTSTAVGIGTATPSQPLDVNGTSVFRNNLYFGTGAQGSAGFLSWATASPPHLILYGNSGYGISLGTNGITDRLFIDTTGNVGIGTTTPGATSPSGIALNANSRVLEIKNAIPNDYVALLLRRQDDAVGLDVTTDGATAGIVYLDSRWAQPSSGGFLFRTQTAGSPVNALRLLGNGNVGVGMTAPPYKLSVLGRIWAFAELGSDNLWNMYTADYGNGVNDAIYAYKMNAYGVTSAAVGFGTNALQNGDAGLRFYTRSGALAERMRITDDGNVGVGTTSPNYRLDVNGAAHISGDLIAAGSITGARVLNAVYQDLAEWVPSTESLTPGTVVVVDPSRVNHVLASTRAYDTAIAGVVSASPGIILGTAGPGQETIATTGRVKVKADATRAPIQPGDVLVTSDVPGTAMKSEPVTVAGTTMHRPGTILGKALQPLPSGRGAILVLLSLQ